MLTMLCDVTRPALSMEPPSYISKVSISSTTLDLGKGESVRIQYSLDREAPATIRIYDAEHCIVRTVAQGRPSFAGMNTVSWDGLDDAGHPVPDEVYYFTITCTDRQGRTASYDPPTFSGGEQIAFSTRDMRHDPAAKAVVYHLSRPARVQIRAGVREGPLLKTIADWAPRQPGRYMEPWDEKDKSGVVNVTTLKNWNLIGRAYTLPENSISVTGGPTRAAEVKKPPMPEQERALPSTQVRAEALKRATLIESTLAQRTRPIDPHVWTPFGKNASPRFRISLAETKSAAGSETIRAESATTVPTETPTVSGLIGIQVTMDETTRLRLQEQRFEIVAYVDYQLIGEQEQGYSPYTYVLDTTTFPNGEHVVTINVAGLQDQLSAESLKIKIHNPGSR